MLLEYFLTYHAKTLLTAIADVAHPKVRFCVLLDQEIVDLFAVSEIDWVTALRLPFIIFCLLSSWFGLASAQVTKPYILWPPPASVTYPTPLSSVQLNARALTAPPVPVSLDSVYDVSGITSLGVPYNTGGFDGSSWAYSAELLGTSITWQGITFPLGPADKPDAVYGKDVPLPAGSFSSILMLGDLVNNGQPPTATFVIHYSDGSTSAVEQTLSDWVNPRNYPGESLAQCYPSRHNYDGTTDLNSVCVYGYQLPLDPARSPISITLPADRNVVVLSLVLLPPSVAGSFSYTPAEGTILTPGTHSLAASFTPDATSGFGQVGTSNTFLVAAPVPPVTSTITWPAPAPVVVGTALSPIQLNATASAAEGPILVPLAPYYRVNAFYNDGAQFEERGFDDSGTAFSANQLGAAVYFDGYPFPLGPAAIPDATTSSTIALPKGKYTKLDLIGAAAVTAQLAQPFVITYTDGTTSTVSLNLSSWTSPQHFTDETIVAATTLGNQQDGTQLAGSYNLYGYQLPIDSSRYVASLTLPANTNVLFLAGGLRTGNSFPITGSFSYDPAAGFVPAASMTLTTNFTPADAVDFTSATATAPLIVGSYDFVLQAAGSPNMTAVTGDSPSFLFSVSPTQNRYAGPISFSIQGTLPPLATVSFSPSSLSMSSGRSTVTITIQTRRLSSSNGSSHLFPGQTGSIAVVFALICLPFGMRRRFRTRMAVVLVLLCGLLPTGCGSGYADHVYPLTVVATDGYTTHTLPIDLHILASRQ